MPAPKPLVECSVVPPGSALSTVYTPWFFADFDLLLADEDAEFLTELIFALRADRIDASTALFAEADLLLNGWHTADVAQPDRTALHRQWTVYLTAREQLKRNT